MTIILFNSYNKLNYQKLNYKEKEKSVKIYNHRTLLPLSHIP